MARIRRPESLPERFARRGMSFEDFSRGQEPTLKARLVDLVLRFAPRMVPLVEEFHDREHSSREPDGSLVVSVSLPEDGWLYGFILSYGAFVEVLEPPRIRDTASEIRDIYE